MNRPNNNDHHEYHRNTGVNIKNHKKMPKTSTSNRILWSILAINTLGILFSNNFYVKHIDSTTHDSPLPKSSNGMHAGNPLMPPAGIAIPLPSIRTEEKAGTRKTVRQEFGGEGDRPHLGGFLTNDVDMLGTSPALWKYMIHEIGIKSILDIGCGRGVSTSWFDLHGVDALCVEGSHDAAEQTLLRKEQIIEHDFSRGPWWPPRTVDAIWCVEVLEHIGRNFHVNILPSFRKAALIYVTHSTWGGWHHVEVHASKWWIQKFESFGFKYSAELTEEGKEVVKLGRTEIAPNGKEYFGQHMFLHLLVFINPTVASLPEHHHLFARGGHSCFKGNKNDPKTGLAIIHRPCGEKEESTLPESFLPLPLDEIMDERWENLVFGSSKKVTKKKIEISRDDVKLSISANSKHTSSIGTDAARTTPTKTRHGGMKLPTTVHFAMD